MPKIGKRNIKTAVSVFLCVVLYLLITLVAYIFYKTIDKSIKLATQIYTPFFACIGAAYSVQNDRKKSYFQAKLRVIASIIGGLVGVFIITIYTQLFRQDWPFSHISATGNPTNDFTVSDFTISYLLSFIIPCLLILISTIIVIWVCNLLRQKQTTFIAVLSLTAVMTSLGTQPIIYGFNRILSTIIGVLIALFVNNFKLPYKNKDKESLFVISLDGIYNDDNNYVYGYNAYKLNNMIDLGCKMTCFTTRTPITLKNMLGEITFEQPVICMSGAALYDMNTLKYLYVCNLDGDVVKELNQIFKNENVSPFINIISNDVLYTYNEKLNHEAEITYANNRKNSAYGAFIEGMYPQDKEVCYILLVEKKEVIKNIKDYILNSNISDKVTLQEYDCYEMKNDDDTYGYSYLKIYNKDILKLDALSYLNTNDNNIIACGTSIYDEKLFAQANYSFTSLNGTSNIKNESNLVLNTTNDEKIFNKLNHIFLHGLK